MYASSVVNVSFSKEENIHRTNHLYFVLILPRLKLVLETRRKHQIHLWKREAMMLHGIAYNYFIQINST